MNQGIRAAAFLMGSMTLSCVTWKTECPEPATPAAQPQAWARATIETRKEDDRDRMLRLLHSLPLLHEASQETEQPIVQSDLELVGQTPTRIMVRVRGDGARAALVRCKALLRVGDRQRGQQADPVRDALAKERDELRLEVKKLEKSLREVSADGGAGEAISVQVESIRLRLLREELKVSQSAQQAAGSKYAPELLRSLAQAALAASDDVQRLRSMGKGGNHPAVVLAQRKADSLQARFQAQYQVESEWLTTAESELARKPAKGGAAEARKARLATLLSLLDRPEATIEHVASQAPLRLRLLAWEYLERKAEDDALAVDLGDRHPRRIQGRERLQALAAEFDTERRVLVEMAKALLAHGVAEEIGKGDARSVQLDDLRLRVAHVLTRLDSIDESSAKLSGSFAILNDCAVD